MRKLSTKTLSERPLKDIYLVMNVSQKLLKIKHHIKLTKFLPA